MSAVNRESILKIISEKEKLLISTHHKLSLPIIRRIYKKMINGINFDDIKLCDPLIIDGHHRYVSSLLAEIELGSIKTLKSKATVEYEWEDVQFVEEEWDTLEKINHLNELDAKYNNLSLEEINLIIQ